CYLDRERAIDFSTTTETHFVFRTIVEQEIDAYVARLPVTIWSSAYSPAHPYGMTFFASINGSLTGNMGLPMEVLIPLLQRSGIVIQPRS
ncbi:MAG: Maf family protein, partial [bacterium]|nr:Maf family protein [bacterium]